VLKEHARWVDAPMRRALERAAEAQARGAAAAAARGGGAAAVKQAAELGLGRAAPAAAAV
jgi:hypothetical protein